MKENVSLKEYTTFKIGGNALYFTLARSVEDLKEALLFAREKKVPVFVLGGGSNIVVSDEGFPGLVIKNEISGIQYVSKEDGVVEVTAGAGENWDDFVRQTVEKGLYGLENLSAIPGTVGAAPVQNIGAYGVEVTACVKEVVAFDTESWQLRRFSNDECRFEYRNSFFKTEEGKKYIIVHVVFNLSDAGKVNITYNDLKKYFQEKNSMVPTLKEVRDAVVEIRTKKLPDLNKYGTAGSFFKNPIIAVSHYETLKKQYPLMPSYIVDETHVKIPLAWVLDNVCGFRGYKKGNVGVYENQALVLVNFGDAAAKEVKQLAEEMISEVKNKTNIDVETEVQFI